MLWFRLGYKLSVERRRMEEIRKVTLCRVVSVCTFGYNWNHKIVDCCEAEV